MFKEISFSAEQNAMNVNIFTFDEDGSEPEQEIQTSYKSQKNQDNQLEENWPAQNQEQKQQKLSVTNLFTFEDDEEDQILSHQESFKHNTKPENENQSNQITQQTQANQNDQDQLSYLKNKILFKEHNYFINKNPQIKNSPSKCKNKRESREPPAITKNFQTKVKKLRQSLKQNDLKNPILKESSSSNSSLKNKQPQRNSHRSINNLLKSFQQNHFEAFKQNKTEEPGKSKFQIKGAKIVTNEDQAKQQFQYVEDQKAIKVTNLREFLFTQLSEEFKVNALITRVQDGGFLGKLVNKTKYLVTIEENSKFIFSVVKDGFNRFIFSMSKDNCSQRNKNYLGQLVGKDFSNTEFLLYDNGFDPKETKCLEYSFKQLASIRYEEGSGPRRFSVVMSTNSKGFHTMESEVNILEKKWAEKKERRNICKLYSKEPQFDETDGNYKLDFKGMMGKASIKNFVLSSDEYEDCLKFARRSNETYALEVRHPFSLVQAIAVCMSSIYHKSIL